jgi:hypothetical protein
MTDPLMDALFAGAQRERRIRDSKVPPTLSVKDGVGILSFEALSLSTYEAGKRMPSRHRWDGKHLRFEPTPQSLDYVQRTWPNVIPLKTLPTYRQLNPEPPPAPVRGQMSWRPRLPRWDHQQRGFDLAAGKPEFAYLWDMGTGKTKAAIEDAAFSFARGTIDRVLVIAPNGVHEQWIDDALPVHWPLELACRRDCLVTGRRKPDWWGEWEADAEDCKWLAINIENFEAFKTKENGREVWRLAPFAQEVADFVEAGRTMVIVDEAHKIKNPQAKRTHAAWKLRSISVQRRTLTGTPIAKGLEDYYAQFRFLNPNIIGVYTMSGFKRQFCIMGGFNGKQITGYRDTEEFHHRIADYSMRVEKDDVLDLPPKLYSERTCDLSGEQRRVLRELKQELMTELTDGSIVRADQMLPRMLRLHQVAQGFLPREDGGFDEFPENKTQLLTDLIETAPDRVAIWCRFTHDIDKLYDLLGRDREAIRYYGANKNDRPTDKARWINDASCRFFIGNAQAGGTGLDWLLRNGPVSTVIYYSNSFNSIDRWQSEDRTHRFGLKGTVNYYDLVTRGSMDRTLLANLRKKRGLSDMSLEELKQIVADL